MNSNSFYNMLKCLLCIFLSVQMVFSSVTAPKNVIYWGQSSDGPEKDLRDYCADNTFDIIVVAFVYLFPTAGKSQYPGMNFAGHCSKTFDKADPDLLDCSDTIAPDITYCQQQGKQILLSFGGGEGTYGFTSDAQGTAFATVVWNMFLGGSSSIRPFGTAIFDGVDLDIEQGTSTGYVAFITQLRQYFATAPKQYYISAAPQCPYPDFLGPGAGSPFTLSWFDYVWIQFYNNNCGLNAYPQKYNFNTWAAWASSTAINPNMKLFIGAPASSKAAGSGYVSASVLQTVIAATHASYPDVFGGVMMWDCSNSDLNGNFGGTIATFMRGLPGVNSSSQVQPVTTHSVKTATTEAAPPVTTHKVKTATTQEAPPLTTHAVTTGHAKSGTSTSSSTTTTSSSTTTSACPSINLGSTSSSSTTGSSGDSSSDDSSVCTVDNEQCVGKHTYQTCDNTRDGSTAWSVTQHCPSGLECNQHNNHVHCS